jgi:hypothetical protein
MFVDGGEKVYQVEDCTAAQLNDTIALLKKNGVPVFKKYRRGDDRKS